MSFLPPSLGSLELDTPAQPVNNHHSHSHTPVESKYLKHKKIATFYVSFVFLVFFLFSSIRKKMVQNFFSSIIAGRKQNIINVNDVFKKCKNEIGFAGGN